MSDISQNWSPEGYTWVFESNRSGSYQFYFIEVDNPITVRIPIVLKNPGSPSWSRWENNLNLKMKSCPTASADGRSCASTAQVHENGNGVKLIEIGGHYSISDGEGGSIPFYLTVVFFKPNPNSLTRLTFSFLQDYNAEITTDVNAIIESIKIAGPLGSSVLKPTAADHGQ